MVMLIIPINNHPNQQQTMTFNGKDILMDFVYNNYSKMFMMRLQDVVLNTFLIDSLPLLRGEDLLAPYNFDIGSFYVMGVYGFNDEMDLDNVGIKTFLIWSDTPL